jgi:hypothetical protein
MTLKKWLVSKLMASGFCQEHAYHVVDKFAANQDDDSLDNRWHEDCRHYTKKFLHYLLQTIRPVALSWIDNNISEAWFRDKFIEN